MALNDASDIRRERLQAMLDHELGPAIRTALADPDVRELSLNPDGSLWTLTSSGMAPLPVRMDSASAEALVSTLAALLDRVVTEDQPILEGSISSLNGSRITAVLPPASEAPIFSIRVRKERVFDLQSDYVDQGLLTFQDSEVLRAAVRQHKNILVAGGSGSGKTTLINALLREAVKVAPNTRIAILEDVTELTIPNSNSFRFITSPNVSMRTLVATTLRFDPSRIVVGELRGAEAHDLVKAWNTGHPGGLSSLHANSAADALFRLDSIVQEAGVPSQMRNIARTVHLVIHLASHTSGLGVQEIVEVRPLGADDFTLSSLRRNP